MAGFSLIETLVSLLIFSFVALGATTSMIKTHQQSLANHDHLIALNDLAGASIMIPQSDTLTIQQWQQHIAQQLPNGHASISQNGDEMHITIRWQNHWSKHMQAVATTIVPPHLPTPDTPMMLNEPTETF